MNADRIAQALARIDAASRRIEASASRPVVAAADPDLERRYLQLRRDAGAALADLDSLIGEIDE